MHFLKARISIIFFMLPCIAMSLTTLHAGRHRNPPPQMTPFSAEPLRGYESGRLAEMAFDVAKSSYPQYPFDRVDRELKRANVNSEETRAVLHDVFKLYCVFYQKHNETHVHQYRQTVEDAHTFIEMTSAQYFSQPDEQETTACSTCLTAGACLCAVIAGLWGFDFF